MGLISQKQTVNVKRVISVKRTLRFSGRGFATAAIICGLSLFSENMTQSTDVKANYNGKPDTLITANNVNRGDSLVNNNSNQNGIHSEDSNHLLTDKDLSVSKKKKKNNTDNRGAEYHDMITITPKQTTGVFEINFEIPVEQVGVSRIQIVNKKGEVIESRNPTSESGLVNEVFTLDNSIPSGVYLVKVKVGKSLYVRQVVYTKS